MSTGSPGYRYHDQPASSSRFSITNNLIRQRSQRMKCITVSLLGFAIFSILFAYVAFGENDTDARPAIKLAYVIFRHGDRNPTESYPTDPYNDLKYWPGGWGALSNKGKLQMYNLGAFLRARYKDVLGEVYSSDRLLVRSSYNDRCLMSAGALLAGLQPPSVSEIWLPGLNWHPIPVHSTPRSLDQLIVVKKKCPSYEKELQNAYKSEKMRKFDSENANLYQYISTHSGQNISSVLDVEFLFNTIEIEEANGHQLPQWTKNVYPQPMKNIATRSLGVFTDTLEMKRFMGGPLLDDVKVKMQNNHNQAEQKPQVFLIAGHDTTVINVMRSLGFNDAPKPEIGAALLFELHAGPSGLGESTDYVKIFYMNSSSTTDPVNLKLPGCNEPCSLNDFTNALTPIAVTPSEWEAKCNE